MAARLSPVECVEQRHICLAPRLQDVPISQNRSTRTAQLTEKILDLKNMERCQPATLTLLKLLMVTLVRLTGCS